MERVPLYGTLELSQSGMMMQQQLRTSPPVARTTSLAIRFLEFHTSEIRFPIPARSAGCGVCSKFVMVFTPSEYSFRHPGSPSNTAGPALHMVRATKTALVAVFTAALISQVILSESKIDRQKQLEEVPKA